MALILLRALQKMGFKPIIPITYHIEDYKPIPRNTRLDDCAKKYAYLLRNDPVAYQKAMQNCLHTGV